MQDKYHEYKNNEGEDDDTSKIADKDIPEEGVHHLHITSPNEQRVYNLSPRKPMKYPRVDNYAHVQIVHYAMMQY